MTAAANHPNAPNGHRRRAEATPAPARTLPHDISCEASILGGIILRNELLAELTELETADFYDHKHRVVFEAMRNLEVAGRPIDVIMLENEIEKVGKLDAIGGIAFLGELALRVPTVDNVLAYAGIVTTHSKGRKAILALSSALERAYTWQHDPAELVAEVAGELARFDEDGAAAAVAKRARWVTPIEDFLGNEEPDDNDAEDWIVRDLVPRAEPVLWGGPMKGGKTWAALDMLIAIARGDSWLGFENTLGPTPAVGLFLEDSKRRVLKRVWELCRGRATDHGFLTPNDKLIRQNLHITRAALRIPDPKDVRRFIAEIKARGAKYVVIDNLTRIFVGDPNSTRDASAFTRAWCDICEETGASVLLLHHTKKVMGGDKEIDPFDTLRGSGDFGAAARNIIVVSPIRQDNGPAMAEIRMRGNLDLKREGFVLGFEREEVLGKWRAKMTDKGEIGSVKEDIKKQRIATKEEDKKKALAEQYRLRRELALKLAANGGVSQATLAASVGLSSPRAVAPLLQSLVREGLLVVDQRRGYVLKEAEIEVNTNPLIARAEADSIPGDAPQGSLL